jgi:diguanylate cyclase (GGDEF)-like protein
VPGWPAVAKGYVAGLIDVLGLGSHAPPESPHSAVDLAMRLADRLADEWSELCRWDPEVPVGAEPPVTASVIEAVSAALTRPQPLGWGLDPALEPAAEAFGLNVGDPVIALAQLVCLQEAFARLVVEPLPIVDQLDALRRLNMIISRTMVTVADSGIRRLARLALVDPLTGIGNRRAFDVDLSAELAHAARHGGHVTLAVIDVDGLKVVNDRDGHVAGDDLLRRTANALRTAARRGDRSYRLGGDEFAVILRDAVLVDPGALRTRLQDDGAPAISVGTATTPPDAPETLLEQADARLYESRRRAHHHTRS